MSSYPIPFTDTQIQILFQNVVLGFLFPNDSTVDYSKVRIGWPQIGQPAQDISTDVCYIRAVEADDLYNRMRDQKYNTKDPALLNKVVTYTRVWTIFFILYGPTAFDHARQIRSAFMNDDSVHDQLAGSNLYQVTDPSSPVRVPEERDGQWWERIDFECQFNESVTEENQVNSVASAEVFLENSTGVVRDIKVQVP